MRASTTAIRRAIPEMPSAVFLRLVDKLSREELRRFPPHRIPPDLPRDFADRLCTGKRDVITDLMLEAEADRLHGRFELADRYGDALIDALHQLEHAPEPLGLARCEQHLHELEEAAAAGMAERHRIARALAGSLGEVYEPCSALHEALERVAQADIQAPDRARFDAATDRGRALVAPIDELICRFYGLRLGFAVQEMGELRGRLKQQACELEQIDARIQQLNAHRNSGSARLLRALGSGRGGAREEKLTELIRRKRLLQVPIDEAALTAWLDVVTESSLHEPSQRRWAQVLRRARIHLLQVLNAYCADQEGAARDAASLPFTQVDARKVIEFSLRSESFILGYFGRKREQQAGWLTGAARERLGRLDELQQDLLRELKRNQRRG